MVGHSFQIAGYQKRVERLLGYLRLFVHLPDQDDKGFVPHAINYVIHFEHGLGEFGFTFDKRFQCPAHHGADGRGHARDVDWQFDSRELDQIHDALCDVYGLVANALEVGVDLGDRQNKSQVGGRRLLRGQDIESEFVNLALSCINEAFIFEDELAAREVALGIGLAGAIHRQLRQTAHAK